MFSNSKALIVVANQKDHLSASNVIYLFRSLLAGPELTITVACPREDNEVIQTSLPLVNCAYRLGTVSYTHLTLPTKRIV